MQGSSGLPLLSSICDFGLLSKFLSAGCYPSRSLLRAREKARSSSMRRVFTRPGPLILSQCAHPDFDTATYNNLAPTLASFLGERVTANAGDSWRWSDEYLR